MDGLAVLYSHSSQTTLSRDHVIVSTQSKNFWKESLSFFSPETNEGICLIPGTQLPGIRCGNFLCILRRMCLILFITHDSNESKKYFKSHIWRIKNAFGEIPANVFISLTFFHRSTLIGYYPSSSCNSPSLALHLCLSFPPS